MCLSIEISVAGMLAGYGTATTLFFRNEGVDRGRSLYLFLHGTWQALDALLWYDMEVRGNQCSQLNNFVSNTLLPFVICLMLFFQMHMGDVLCYMSGLPLSLNNWHAFKFFSLVALCYFIFWDEIATGECTTILEMPTLISNRILEWCNTEFSYKALAVYAYSAVVGYDDPAEPSRWITMTQTTILYIAVTVVVAQIVFFGSFHLSLLCLFCFGMCYPALFGTRKLLRSHKACW